MTRSGPKRKFDWCRTRLFLTEVTFITVEADGWDEWERTCPSAEVTHCRVRQTYRNRKAGSYGKTGELGGSDNITAVNS
jgi:hypothetical protein